MVPESTWSHPSQLPQGSKHTCTDLTRFSVSLTILWSVDDDVTNANVKNC